MNDLTRFVALPFESLQTYRVVDKDGNPWFVVKDICEILEIKQPARAVKDFPKEECTIVIIIHNGKNGKKVPHRLLIINESGLFRLILKSRKPVAQQLRENIIKVLPKIRKHGLNWASLPETWGKDSLVWSEWVAKKEKNYFRRHPDASHEDFIMSLPNR